MIINSYVFLLFRVWDLPSGKCIDYFKFPSPATSMDFSPAGDMLATSHVQDLGQLQFYICYIFYVFSFFTFFTFLHFFHFFTFYSFTVTTTSWYLDGYSENVLQFYNFTVLRIYSFTFLQFYSFTI